VLHGGEWSASCPSRLTPGERAPRYPLDRRMGGPQRPSRRDGKKSPYSFELWSLEHSDKITRVPLSSVVVHYSPDKKSSRCSYLLKLYYFCIWPCPGCIWNTHAISGNETSPLFVLMDVIIMGDFVVSYDRTQDLFIVRLMASKLTTTPPISSQLLL